MSPAAVRISTLETTPQNKYKTEFVNETRGISSGF